MLDATDRFTHANVFAYYNAHMRRPNLSPLPVAVLGGFVAMLGASASAIFGNSPWTERLGETPAALAVGLLLIALLGLAATVLHWNPPESSTAGGSPSHHSVRVVRTGYAAFFALLAAVAAVLMGIQQGYLRIVDPSASTPQDAVTEPEPALDQDPPATESTDPGPEVTDTQPTTTSPTITSPTPPTESTPSISSVGSNDPVSIQQIEDAVNGFLSDSQTEMFSVVLADGVVKLQGARAGSDSRMAKAAIERFPGVTTVLDETLLRLEEGDNLNQALDVDSVTFADNSADLDASGIRVLQRIASFLEAHKEVRIEIQGHTDTSGGASTNQALSEDRAAAVHDWLGEEIDPIRLKAVGYGESSPLIRPDPTEAERSVNRRIDFVVQETYSIPERPN